MVGDGNLGLWSALRNIFPGADGDVLRFPLGHWRHLRTSNVIESPFAALRLRADAAKRFKKVANATGVVWKMLLVAERKFRRINSPELLPAVAAGQQYHDGLPIKGGQHQKAAA